MEPQIQIEFIRRSKTKLVLKSGTAVARVSPQLYKELGQELEQDAGARQAQDTHSLPQQEAAPRAKPRAKPTAWLLHYSSSEALVIDFSTPERVKLFDVSKVEEQSSGSITRSSGNTYQIIKHTHLSPKRGILRLKRKFIINDFPDENNRRTVEITIPELMALGLLALELFTNPQVHEPMQEFIRRWEKDARLHIVTANKEDVFNINNLKFLERKGNQHGSFRKKKKYI